MMGRKTAWRIGKSSAISTTKQVSLSSATEHRASMWFRARGLYSAFLLNNYMYLFSNYSPLLFWVLNELSDEHTWSLAKKKVRKGASESQGYYVNIKRNKTKRQTWLRRKRWWIRVEVPGGHTHVKTVDILLEKQS